jgi:ATP-dependent DNA helicase RecG
MMTTPEPTAMLDRILAAARIGENDDWEFKAAKGGLPRSLWETYSAMANSAGGTIVLGVREDDGVFIPEGLDRAKIDQYQKALWDGLNDRGMVNRNLVQPGQIRFFEIDSGWLLAMQVARADRTQRPVHRGQNPFGGTYIRRGEGDYRCADADVRRMFADASDVPADARILPGFGMDDLDAASITAYRNMFSATRPAGHPWLTLSNQDLLEQLGGWRSAKETGTSGLTAAGLLMFGKTQTITSPEGLPRFGVDYRDHRGRKPEERWGDRVVADGTWEANLFQFYRRIWPKLSGDLKVPFKLKGVQRVDETPVHEALREAVVNAMIHADYSVGGSIVIKHNDDGYVIENPGTLLVSPEQLRRGSVSECRNRYLQRMFSMIGVGEQAGSGFARIRGGWISQHWRAPLLTTQHGPDRVCLDMPMASLIPEEVFIALREKIGTAFERLDERERVALATALIEDDVSNTRMQDLVTDQPSEITKVLRGLVAKGLLEQDNQRRWTRYKLPAVIVPRADLFSERGVGADSPHNGGNSPPTEVNSPRTEEHSRGNGGVQSRPGANSPLSDAEVDALRPIAEPVSKQKRASPEKLHMVVLALCRGRFLTLDQLAKLCNREADGLRDRMLTKLVREGTLVRLYPDAPNRPDQAYTTAEGAS